MENNGEKLSQKSYSIIRLLKYIAFVCLIAMMFLPIIRIESVDEQMDMKATASISPFQLLIGDTVTEAKIDAGDEELDGFLNGLIGSEARKVDVVEEALSFTGDDEVVEIFVKMMKIFSLVFGVIAGVGVIGSASMASKKLALQPTNPNEVIIQDRIYIGQVFAALPTIFAMIEAFIFMIVFMPVMFLGMFNISASIMNDGDVEWQINVWMTVIILVLAVLLKNATITKLIFHKEHQKIAAYSLRYDAPYAPTISSDVKAIFSLSEQATSNSDENELYKYKKLLDDGLITQEEYDQKKKELLNL